MNMKSTALNIMNKLNVEFNLIIIFREKKYSFYYKHIFYQRKYFYFFNQLRRFVGNENQA